MISLRLQGHAGILRDRSEYPRHCFLTAFSLLLTARLRVNTFHRYAAPSGFLRITNADISRVAIDQMKETYKAYHMECELLKYFGAGNAMRS